MNWISYKDQEPNDGQRVLFYVDGYPKTESLNTYTGVFRKSAADGCDFFLIDSYLFFFCDKYRIFWMPLPKQAKE